MKNGQSELLSGEVWPWVVAVGLLRADAPREIMGAPQTWPRWSVLLPHVLAVADHASPEIAATNAGQAADLSWLLDRAGTYLQVRGRRLSEAAELLTQALHLDETVHGPDHPTVAADLNNLALILQDLGQTEQAQQLAERALHIDETTHGPDHPDVATDLNNLATILQDLGQPEQARPLAERALHIDETTHGLDHPAVATDLNNLAVILQDLGQLEQARPLAERAVHIAENRFDQNHPRVRLYRDNLAGLADG